VRCIHEFRGHAIIGCKLRMDVDGLGRAVFDRLSVADKALLKEGSIDWKR
jgi:hypothetical protein